MSKQSSVDWFQEQIIQIVNGTCELTEIQIFEQAKAMHRKEIEEAWYNSLTKADYLSADEYYNETFGDEKEML